MMLTAELAREKRCCGPSGCGTHAGDNLRYCVADECMAWTTARLMYRDAQTGAVYDQQMLDGRLQEIPVGFCALAPDAGGIFDLPDTD